VYYFSAYADAVNSGRIENGDPVNFAVPTGNFGDILAGFYAKLMGLPVHKFICASNSNNVLTDFINTGVYNRKRPFHKTISPSMDILVSSNLERLLFEETDHDAAQVAEWMKELNEKGEYKVGVELQNKILKDFFGTWVDEVETRETIGDVFNNYGYVMDPHTAVAYKAMEKYRLLTSDDTYSIVLSTASPFKFNDVVLQSINPDKFEGKTLDPFVAMEELSREAKMPIPRGMKELPQLEKRQSDVVDKTQLEAEVKKVLGLE
jgi:threonine synthase